VDSYPQVSPPSSCYPKNSKKRNNVLPEAAHYMGGKGSWKKKASSPLESDPKEESLGSVFVANVKKKKGKMEAG
jgi:hypothetical protein